MSKKLDQLQRIDSSNLAVSAHNSATSVQQLSNISTEPLIECKPFDTQTMSNAYQAQAGLQEHLNFAAAVVGSDPLQQLRQDLQPYAAKLTELRLPDTTVSIGHQKIDIPYEVKQYGNDMDPKKYNDIVGALVGKTRLRSLRGHMLRSNQAHTPGLWLNQAVWIETKKPYVYLLGREDQSQEKIKKENLVELTKDQIDKTTQYIQLISGNLLFSALMQIAEVTKLPVYAVFVLIVDAIIQRRDALGAPITADSIWAAAEGQDEDEE